MESRNKGMGKVALGVLSSLSESYTLLPFMVFSSLVTTLPPKGRELPESYSQELFLLLRRWAS